MVEIQRLASAALGHVLAGRSLDAELAAAWRRHPQLDGHDRAAIQDLAYGALRFRARLDALLDALLDKPLKDARLRMLLLVALYQLEYTRAAPHAVVDHAVRACHGLGFTSAKSLANAVLRNFLRRRSALCAGVDRAETARYCHPQWWIDKLHAQYPAHFAGILAAANAHPPLALRVNCRRARVADYLELLARNGIKADAGGAAAVVLEKPLPAERIPGLAEGLVSVQDAAAQLAAPLLDLRDGMRVLDACAAPGGKAGHALELAEVALTALDRDAARLERVRANLVRLGLSARIVCADACEPAAWWDGAAFERILLDVPCSASGVARRHPDIKSLRRETDIAQFAREQGRMLDALWQTLASGGKLLYATCSVFQEENSEQVARFLERHRNATRLTLPAVDNDIQLPAGQLLPDGRHDGFFYALLQKV
ncbi:MAG: 16S rRNA (cytosine(967)-C(5))-methyltransferase [Betaproteobacteria bacterium RIFCSPLOWO2_02_FULL_67_26]|nr:MAG: 16S rRNA (cytosine(967)-C(5))-methyltransferase [Betaproteobacteria bacterium RIFCSPLOWO2_02_FULL_67_26]